MSKASNNQASDPTSRRQRLRAEREQAAKEARVRRVITVGTFGVVAVAVIGLIVWGAVALMGRSSAADSKYAVSLGKAGASVTVDIYQDFMCPGCGSFERTNRADLTAMVDAGTASLRIHPMSFLDESSQGTRFSTRAANAFVTVYKAEPDKALAFSQGIFESQPKEGSTGLTDEKLVELAKQAGVSEATAATFAQLSNADFVANTTKEAFTAGINSTPTVLINGTKFTEGTTPGALKAAVEKAASGQ